MSQIKNSTQQDSNLPEPECHRVYLECLDENGPASPERVIGMDVARVAMIVVCREIPGLPVKRNTTKKTKPYWRRSLRGCVIGNHDRLTR